MEWIVETVLPREVRKLFSAIEEKDHQIQTNQQKILRFNEDIDDLIKKQARNLVDILTTCCASSKRMARRPTHITLFNVNIYSLKKIRDV